MESGFTPQDSVETTGAVDGSLLPGGREPETERGTGREPQEPNGEMENKVVELGVFAIGLGLIGAALMAYMVYLEKPRNDNQWIQAVGAWVIAGGFVFLGMATLVFRSEGMVRATQFVLCALIALSAAMSFNPFSILIAAGVIYLIVKTAKQAVKQISRHVPTDSTPRATETTPKEGESKPEESRRKATESPAGDFRTAPVELSAETRCPSPTPECEDVYSGGVASDERLHPDLRHLSTDALYRKLLNMVGGISSRAESLIAFEAETRKGSNRHVCIAWAIERLWDDRR
jgi:hypothetical protein